MTFVARMRPLSVAVALSIVVGPKPFRLMAIETRFPDIGDPVSERAGFLRYPGEPILGDAEPVAAGPTSDHHV